MESQISNTPLRQKHLTRDKIFKIQLLRGLEWIYEAIAYYLSITQYQVQYAYIRERLILKKYTGRRPLLSE